MLAATSNLQGCRGEGDRTSRGRPRRVSQRLPELTVVVAACSGREFVAHPLVEFRFGGGSFVLTQTPTVVVQSGSYSWAAQHSSSLGDGSTAHTPALSIVGSLEGSAMAAGG